MKEVVGNSLDIFWFCWEDILMVDLTAVGFYLMEKLADPIKNY